MNVAAPAQHNWVIWLSFLLAMMLSTLPMPESLVWGRPEWVTLTLIYWVVALPHRVGLWSAWILGLLLDILLGSLLGVHALSLTIVAYLAQRLHQRIRMFPLWQQAFLVLILVGIQQMLLHWAQTLTGTSSESLLFLLPSLVSAFLWPWIFVLLRGVRRALHVT
ncbi:rod shape-determining protein MreD [Motiliproteus sp. MSK22-1]|uniref:rod shape-determining protein MreD n=1 Tax=Motiliproteus sp. MSK22-1 TaxID=1897630 RepID=UPI0009789573|nr:rod shape-determining protein MreD [Motiliproteus sp. MSK22-1]